MHDPTMDIARLLADALAKDPPSPAWLADASACVAAIERMETDVLRKLPFDRELPENLSRLVLDLVADPTVVPGVTQVAHRASIILRLWAGCLDGAKTIALVTNSGPNTPELRAAACLVIEERAKADSIYRAGVLSARSFKTGRGDVMSLDGIPRGALLAHGAGAD